MERIALGDAGEKIAVDYLRKAGYKILALKYRAKTGEIDIIASKNGMIIFVEVKTRRGIKYGRPAEAVNYNKQRKIINTAWCFLQQAGKADAPLRFDVMEVLLSSDGKIDCCHIINAFGR